MSLGAITPGVEVGRSGGPVILVNLSFDGDDSYPTGGTAGLEQLVRDALGGENVELLAVVAQDCGLFLPSYDKANDTLLVRNLTDGTEVADTTDLSTTTFNVLAIAK